MPSSVPFGLRPSAQPFIPSRARPSPTHSVSVVPACRGPASSAPVTLDHLSCEGPAHEERFAHLPSVGTWMQKSPRSCPQGASGKRSVADAAIVRYGSDSLNQKESSDARLMNLIQNASQKSIPASVLNLSGLPAPQALVQFQPSVGTWLQPRNKATIPPASLTALTLPEVQGQDENSEVTIVTVEPRLASSPVPEEQDGLGLHFFHLDFEKVDLVAFKDKLLESLKGIGCSEALLASLAVKLRPGAAGSIAEIRGTTKAVQQLKSMPVYTVQVMGYEAKSAASAAALAATAGVRHLNLPSSSGSREQTTKSEAPSGSYPPSLSSSPLARQPLLGDHPSRLTSAESRTPFLAGTPSRQGLSPISPDGRSRHLGMHSVFRRAAMMPTERRKAGPKRLQARDSWNVEELRLSDILTRSFDLQEGTETIDPGLEEKELTELLSELYAKEPDLESVHWTFHLASRRNSRCTRASDLHYACRAHHYCHFLPQATMRTLATTNVSSRGAVDSTLLQHLLEDLNDGYTVPAAEVKTVLDEADALASIAGSGRAALLRAISAWYLNVVRSDSPWTITLKACYGRWIPQKGYHLEVFRHFRDALVSANEAFHEEHNPDSAGQAVWLLLRAAILFTVLVFPSGFFLWLVILGAEHGDDRCPKDLDGLITWFGGLGLAILVVGWVDGTQFEGQMVKASSIGLALKAVLLLMPWVGAFWTFHLASKDQQICGLFLTEASSLLWATLLFAELVLGFMFLWHFAIFNEHEMTLRKGNIHPA